MNATPLETFVLGIAGGSGAAYGIRLLEVLLRAGHRVHLVATEAGLRVLRYEAGIELEEHQLEQLVEPGLRANLVTHELESVESTPASGSAEIAAVVICPCSMGTLARVTHGLSSNLLERSADVALKERRKLVVVPRETPLSVVHLRNMLLLAEAGGVVLPAMPGFYQRPERVADLVDFVVARILDVIGVEHELVKRWSTPVDSARPDTRASVWDEGEG